jgi:hypothetical protein
LGAVACPSGYCASLARTSDGGSTWAPATVPAINLGVQPAVTGSFIRFANLKDGWIVTHASGLSDASLLWYTHDSGQTWHVEASPAGPSARIMALEASNGEVTMVTLTDGIPGDQIFTSPVMNEAWKAVPATLPLGAGPVPAVQMVLQGSSGWIVDVDRTVIGGARRAAGGSWTTWTAPCSTANGSAVLSASTASDLFVICDEGIWGPAPGNAMGNWLYASSNAGTSFSRVGQLPSAIKGVTTLSSPAGVTTTLLAGSGQGLVATFDGGRTWQTVYAANDQRGIIFVGFTTSTQGLAVASSADGSASTLLMTYDGGHTWSPVHF